MNGRLRTDFAAAPDGARARTLLAAAAMTLAIAGAVVLVAAAPEQVAPCVDAAVAAEPAPTTMPAQSALASPRVELPGAATAPEGTTSDLADRTVASPRGGIVVQLEAVGAIPDGVTIALTETDLELKTTVVAELPPDAQGRVLLQRRWCSSRRDAAVCVDAGFVSAGGCTFQLEDETDAVRLMLPELAWLRIEAQEADGAPLRERAVAEVRVVTAATPADRLHRCELVGGVGEVLVECSALVLEIGVTTLDGRRIPTHEVVGPERPGERLPVVLGFEPRAEFTTRLFDAIGQPLGNTAVEVRLANTSVRLDADPVTDDSGRLKIRRPERATAQPWRLLLSATRGGIALHGELTAGLGIDAPRRLDDAWLMESPRLVAGRCVDADGQPLVGLHLRLQHEVGRDHPHALMFGSPWCDVAQADAVTGPDGRFEVRGPQLAGALRLMVCARRSQVTTFETGDDDLQLVVR